MRDQVNYRDAANPTNFLAFPLPPSLGESQSLGLYEETEAFKLEDCRQKQCCGAARAQEPVRKNDNRITASTDITEIPIIEKDFFHTPRQR